MGLSEAWRGLALVGQPVFLFAVTVGLDKSELRCHGASGGQ